MFVEKFQGSEGEEIAILITLPDAELELLNDKAFSEKVTCL